MTLWGSSGGPLTDGFKWTAFFVAGHIVLTIGLKAIYGEKRSTIQISGGVASEANNSKSKIRDLLAYNILTLFYQCLCAYVGLSGWFDGTASAINGSTHDRLYSFSATSSLLIYYTFGFEVYNTFAVIYLSEYRTAAFVGHHLVTGTLAYLAMHPFLHYYGYFFFGLAAVSSVPLAAIEVFNLTGLSGMQELCQGCFAVGFLVIRTVYWPYISYIFWNDVVTTWQGRKIHSEFAAVFFLSANVALTSLQMFWTTKVLGAISDKLSGKDVSGRGKQS